MTPELLGAYVAAAVTGALSALGADAVRRTRRARQRASTQPQEEDVCSSTAAALAVVQRDVSHLQARMSEQAEWIAANRAEVLAAFTKVEVAIAQLRNEMLSVMRDVYRALPKRTGD